MTSHTEPRDTVISAALAQYDLRTLRDLLGLARFHREDPEMVRDLETEIARREDTRPTLPAPSMLERVATRAHQIVMQRVGSYADAFRAAKGEVCS